MSFVKYLNLEFIKIKSSYIKYTLILPIIISLGMILIDIILRKEAIISKYSPIITDGFQALLVENHLALIWPIILLFSIILNSISIFYIDLKNNLLTHILSSPISRNKYYLSKLISILTCTIISILLEGIVLVIVGYKFSLSHNIDIPLVIRYMWMQFFCCFGIIGLQGFLFALTRKVTFLTSINIAALCCSILLLRYHSITKLIPYLQIANSMPLVTNGELIVNSIFFSCINFIVFTALGLIIFNNIDIQEE
ncbi:ABC transporter permease [Clostridium estertheticum]|uniref:ABC transporter permease n=1 Tax=Clostridium estertheticum TaxID=238834 RepID=UPI001CF5BBFB|nr:ABC transporter permease [Clostridium estertheticum]MCB2358241.1 ABC transporter permease [Clostridium estertheticum]